MDAFLIGTTAAHVTEQGVRIEIRKEVTTMKKAATLLANLLMSSALFWSVPTVNADEVILSVPSDTSAYCHMKFPPIREDTLSWDRPVLNENAGNIVDFYGPCDHDPLGAEEVRVQRQMLRNELFGDTE